MKGKNTCEKYGLAITNYALDEEMNVSRQELFNHLRKCKQCREELFDWQNSLAVLRAEEYHNRPEVKNRTKALIREFNKELVKSMPEIEPIPGGEVLDPKATIGNAAGMVWTYLAKNGWVNIKDLSQALKREAKLHPDDTKFGVAWLAYENKVYLGKKKKTTYFYLTPSEREIYQAQAQV